MDIEDVKEAVRREMDGPGQLLGYRSMQQKVREIHGLNVPRDVVYAVMKEVSPKDFKLKEVWEKQSDTREPILMLLV